MKSQDFNAFKPIPVPQGMIRAFVISIAKDRQRPWAKESLYALDQGHAVALAIDQQQKYPAAKVSLNGAAALVWRSKVYHVIQRSVSGSFYKMDGAPTTIDDPKPSWRLWVGDELPDDPDWVICQTLEQAQQAVAKWGTPYEVEGPAHIINNL